MSSSREHLIMVLRAERRPKTQKRVIDRVLKNLCLGSTREGRECCGTPVKLGLCQRCHNAFMYESGKMSETDAAAYRQRLIAAGALLADREISKIRNQSVFRRLA